MNCFVLFGFTNGSVLNGASNGTAGNDAILFESLLELQVAHFQLLLIHMHVLGHTHSWRGCTGVLVLSLAEVEVMLLLLLMQRHSSRRIHLAHVGLMWWHDIAHVTTGQVVVVVHHVVWSALWVIHERLLLVERRIKVAGLLLG